jgi:hypothetical protein
MARNVKSQKRSSNSPRSKATPPRRPQKAPPAGAKKPAPKAGAKKPAPKAGKKAAAPRKAAVATGEGSSPPVDPAIIERIRARWPAPTDVQRTAYRSQFSDDYCQDLGTKTRAELVRREALGWIVSLDTALRSPSGNTIRYTGARLRWLMEQVDALDTEIQAQRAEQGTTKTIKQTAAQAEQTARAVLDDLEDVLRDVAGERPADKREYDNALTALQAPEDVVERLTSLAKLGARWLALTDPVFKALVEEHKLTHELVERAGQMALALGEARTGARGTRLEPRDAPTVNRAEGRVLAEMKVALRAVESARRTDKTIRALVPGRGTRAAIVGRAKPVRTPPEKTPPEKKPANAKKAKAAAADQAAQDQAAQDKAAQDKAVQDKASAETPAAKKAK